MSIPKSTANSQATAADDAIVLAANTNYIATIDLNIAGAIARGEFETVTRVYDKNVDINTVAQHYIDLGYQVRFLGHSPYGQPAVLFGEHWVDYWTGAIYIPKNIKRPIRMKLGWKP